MKVKVTIERDCCQMVDLEKYQGNAIKPAALILKFCKHCGQLWYPQRATDAAGDTDTEWNRYVPKIT